MNEFSMTVPARDEWALVLRSALNGVGVLSNLSVDMISDLRTACDEAFDLLTHQPRSVESIKLSCQIAKDQLKIWLKAERKPTLQQCHPVDPEVAHLIIGTLVTDVHLEGDSCGIYGVYMSLPAQAS